MNHERDGENRKFVYRWPRTLLRSLCPCRGMASDETEVELRTQLREAFSGADYPVHNQMDLLPALPNGPNTRFEAGDGEVSFTAMEMGAQLGDYQDFPYDSVDSLVDDIMDGLREQEML